MTKVIYSNKAVDQAITELWYCSELEHQSGHTRPDEIEVAVQKSLAQLSEVEREVILGIHFLGRSYDDLSRVSNREVVRLATVHKRALKKLKRNLAEFVRRRYGLAVEQPDCEICRSPHRREIELLIAGRDRTVNRGRLMAEIRRRYSLNIRTPQRLIGHERYHMQTLKKESKQYGKQERE